MKTPIIIAAMTYDRVIGKDGKLPWKIPEDLKLFKEITLGNIVIMGRKTYESMGKPLRDRRNLVISRSMPKSEGIEVCGSLEEALEFAEESRGKAFVIGGATIYESALPIADRMYISYVKKHYEGDTFFPEFNHEEWNIQDIRRYDDFSLVDYIRK